MSTDDDRITVSREAFEAALRNLRNPTKVYYTSQASRQEMIDVLEQGLVFFDRRASIGQTTEQKEEQ